MADTTLARKEYLLKPSEQIEISYEIPDSVLAPVSRGEEAGSVRYLLDGVELYSQPFILRGDILVQDWRGRFLEFFRRFSGEFAAK